MSWLRCKCGARVSDVVWPSPTEGTLLRQKDQERFLDGASEALMDFFQAVREGRRSEWRCGLFTEGFPDANEPEGDVVNDILLAYYSEFYQRVSECEKCGRLHVQRQRDENVYVSFAPDEPGYHAVLSSEAQAEAETPATQKYDL